MGETGHDSLANMFQARFYFRAFTIPISFMLWKQQLCQTVVNRKRKELIYKAEDKNSLPSIYTVLFGARGQRVQSDFPLVT